MRQIRNGVFETNSSSTHSFCISKEPVKDKNVPTYLNIRTDKDFGWETDCYNSPEEKAAYLCAVMEWCELDAEKEEFLNKLKNEFHIKISYKSKNGYVDHSGEMRPLISLKQCTVSWVMIFLCTMRMKVFHFMIILLVDMGECVHLKIFTLC